MVVYCPDIYKTRRIYGKAVDDSLYSIKLFSRLVFTSKMIKELLTTLYADDTIVYFNEDSGDVTFSYNKIGILSLDLNNINLDDTNNDEDDLKTIIHVMLLAWHIKFEKHKALKKELSK